MRVMHASAVLLVLASAAAQSQDARPADFGRQWVRSHPFTLMALTQRPEAVADDKYKEAGLNTMLAWKKREGMLDAAIRQGIPWHFHVNKRYEKLSDELKADVQALFDGYKGGTGILVFDEPKLPEMAAAGEVVAWLKERYPNTLIYSDAYPIAGGAKLSGGTWLASGLYDEPPVPYSYDDYLADIVRIIKPDVLMFDIYPFPQPPEAEPEEYLAKKYFASMSSVRKAALNGGIPYWVFVQAYEKEGGGGRRFPSESDLRMQVFCSLAYGFSGLSYFTYDAAFMRGLLETDFSPSRLYHDAVKVNAEVLNLGQSLRFLTSTDVRYVAGQHAEQGILVGNAVPEGTGVYHPNSRVAELVSGIEINDKGFGKDGLVGFFTDDVGASYFMLVNLWHGKGASADERRLSMTIRFAPSVTEVTRLDRETGKPEALRLQDGALTVDLPGGTGDLFRINGGEFPK
jgi:hypothetical protein